MRYLLSSVNQRGHAVSLGGGDPGRVTLWPGHPNQCNLSDAGKDTGSA